MRRIFAFLLLTLIFVTAHAQSEPVKVTDLLRIKSVNSITLSKDGSKAVFTLNQIEPDGDAKFEYKYVNQLWLVLTNGSAAPKQLTTKDNSSQAAFSPDGKQIAFVRAVEGRGQLFLLNLDGGEAIQLTKFKYGAGAPKWSPDGKQLLFSAAVSLKDLLKDSTLNPKKEIPNWPFEKPGFEKNQQLQASTSKADPDGSLEEVRAYLENNTVDRKARVINKLNFQDETDVNADLNFNHFFITDAKVEGKPKMLTRGFYSYGSADFTPDGKKIILTVNPDSLQHPNRALDMSIYTVNTDGSDLKILFGTKGKFYNNPTVSPSGKWLAFQYGIPLELKNSMLAIVPFNSSDRTITDIPFD